MLQQTQVDRVVPKYGEWIHAFPTWRALAHAPRKEVLAHWSGLGYNRRALFLQEMAKKIIGQYHNRLPQNPDILKTLPGIGPYTARSILIFAFNAPLITVDTNIRKVFMNEFSLPAQTAMARLEQIANELLPKKRSREWHNALMDFSSLALPKCIPGIPALSRQSKFEGSIRQIRGEIIHRLLQQKTVSMSSVAKKMQRPLGDVQRAAQSLQREGVISMGKQKLKLAID